jgi:hypothetical protein
MYHEIAGKKRFCEHCVRLSVFVLGYWYIYRYLVLVVIFVGTRNVTLWRKICNRPIPAFFTTGGRLARQFEGQAKTILILHIIIPQEKALLSR